MDKTEDEVHASSSGAEPERRSWFDRTVGILVPIVRILVPLAIPFVIWLIGTQINHSLATMDIELRYVELAVSILTEDGNEANQDLRGWAVEVLQEFAPIALPSGAEQRLRGGELVLPPSSSCTDECSYYGQERWLDDFHYQVCGNHDCDICLEWSEPIYSPRNLEPPESP